MTPAVACGSFDVIQVTNELPNGRLGGVGTILDHLTSGLHRLGVRCLCYRISNLPTHGLTDSALGGVPIVHGTLEALHSIAAPVLHVHCYELEGRLLDLCASRPSLYTVHSLLRVEAETNDIDLPGAIAWQESLIAAVDCVALVSDAEYDAYAGLGYLRLNPRVLVVHNGMRDPGRFRAPRGREVIGFCGRLVPRKRPEFPQLVLNEPGFEHCRTFIAGRGFSHYARNLIARERLEERVEYLGWCAGRRLEAFYDAIDVLAVPSIYEPFGLVALEAVARGIPVVCPVLGGLKEVLGGHGLFYEGGEYAGFREAMTRWRHASAQGLHRLALAARARYRAAFTELHMARSYAGLYRELASRGRS
jgi:glycosyltransferase involved in cell wall biosynthesis